MYMWWLPGEKKSLRDSPCKCNYVELKGLLSEEKCDDRVQKAIVDWKEW